MKKLSSKLFNGKYELNKKSLLSIYGGYYDTQSSEGEVCQSDYDTKNSEGVTSPDWGCIKVPGDDGGIITSGGGSTSTTGGN